jgi:hypothetical protein
MSEIVRALSRALLREPWSAAAARYLPGWHAREQVRGRLLRYGGTVACVLEVE